jgi:hypothetical protein
LQVLARPAVLTASPAGERLRSILTLSALAAVLALALALRLPNLGQPNDNYDEGVYLQSLFLMRHGYRPFADIVATQGPLHLYLAYPPYALGGYTLAAARAGSVLASLAGLAGVAWAGAALGGRVGGLVAALALALSPTYLTVSRQTLAEAPAVALAALAVGAAAWARRTDRDRWRVAAGGLLALACLVKPIVAPAAVPVLLLAWGHSWRSTLLAPVAGCAVALAGLAAVGAGGAVDQVIGWRLGGRQLDPSAAVVSANVDLLIDKMFRQERPAFYALAAAGGAILAMRSPRAGLAMVGWLAAQLAVLLTYVNLHSSLGATIVPALAALAGLGMAAGWSALAGRRWRSAAFVAALVGVWYAASVPALLDRDRRLIAGELSTDRDGGRDERAAVGAIRRLTRAEDWVITDAPYLAFLADRKVPPELVDPSNARIEAGALGAEDVLVGLEGYRPELVILWTGKLARLDRLMEVVDRRFEPVAQFGTVDKGRPRAIYRDPDID